MARGKGRVAGHPTRYEAEIALAERACSLLEEWVEGEPLPEGEQSGGDVHHFLETVCEVLRLEDIDGDDGWEDGLDEA